MSHRRSRPMPALAKAIVIGTLVGFGLILASVFAGGSTFGQRCHSAYPNDPLEAERCTDRVAHGGRF